LHPDFTLDDFDVHEKGLDKFWTFVYKRFRYPRKVRERKPDSPPDFT